MNTNWISVLILYFWLFSGFYSVKRLRNADISPWLLFPIFFLGPLGLLLELWKKYRETILKFFHFTAGKKKSKKDFLNLIFLDSQGNDLFAENDNNSEIFEYVQKMIYEAVVKNCSDVFIDPKEHSYLVRFRIDGMIRTYDTIPERNALPVISMLKVVARMDIAERRRPQDGAFSIICNDLNTSFRIATVGVHGGEKITIRVIASENSKRNLSEIGLSATQYKCVWNSLKLPSGMILMCGPTGSGKTSTLYSMLGEIDYTMKNVISIEDPIERFVPEISQMEVNTKANITFASLLRNSLRQNPDVICLGEIRDEETAEIASHAAQTGHLIIATLHSNDCIGTIVRLTDLGVPLRSIAASLHLIVSQRLVRNLCEHCKKKAELTPPQIEFCNQCGIPLDSVYSAVGCPQCDHTGYSGRRAVFETMVMTQELRALMESPECSITAIQEYLDQVQGANTIFSITGNMVIRGIISLDEFERVNVMF